MQKQRKQPQRNQQAGDNQQQLPIASNEDVEYASELADADDVEASERAAEADRRQMGQMQE